jgi:putative hydrolase of HD superfamily
MKATPANIPATPASCYSSNSRPLRNNATIIGFRFVLFCCAFFALATTTTTISAMSTNNNNGSSSPATNAAAAAATTTEAVAKSTIDFLTMARGLKTTPRTGWIRQKAGPRIESVADHSWRISLMAMVAASSASTSASEQPPYDVNRCIKIALVHDLAEATVGDITPHCGVSDATKHELELEAITGMTSGLALGGGLVVDSTTTANTTATATSAVGAEILDLWKEYEAGATPEAKLVKDMDKLEMILQALEYETDGENEESLDGFFDSTRGKWRTPIGKAWGEEIEQRRKTNQPQRQQQQAQEGTTPADHENKGGEGSATA